jgi:uncharacterized membrane protein
MSETSAGPPPPVPAAPHDVTGGASDLRSLTIVCYVLFLLACVNGLTAIIGVMIAYVKRRDSVNTIWKSHFDNMILVFWIIVAGVVLGMLTWPIALGSLLASSWPYLWPSAFGLPFVFGFLVFPVLAIWYFYRIIRGLIRAGEERPY